MTKEEHKKPKHQPHTTHKKVFDVTRPGKAPASPTSRPVIASQKPPVADDQFVPTAPPLRASDPDAKHDLMDSKHKKELQPLNADQPVPSNQPGQEPSADLSSVPEETSVAAASAPTLPSSKRAEQAAAAPSTTENKAASGAAPAAPPLEAAAPDELAPAKTSAAKEPTPAAEVATPEFASAAEEETPARMAMEQTVDTSEVPIWEHPDTSQQVDNPAPRTHTAANAAAAGKSIEDLLAETGAPILEPEHSPSLIVSHHDPHGVRWWKVLLVIFLLLILAAAILNLLLDAEIITGLDLPHTELF